MSRNRNTILVDFQVEPADGYAERRAAIAMVDERLAGRRRITLGRRQELRHPRFRRSLPHVYRHFAHGAQPAARRWLCARRRQWIRKRVEEAFGWMMTIGGLRRTRYRGCERVQMHAYLVAAAYNLIRIAKLSPAPA